MYIICGGIKIMEIANKDYVWYKIREDLFQYLVNMQLSKRSLSAYNSIFDKLEKFMQSRKENNYSVEIGKAFRKETCNTLSSYSIKVAETVIRRLDDFLAEGKCAIRASSPKSKLPEPFQEPLNGYIAFSKLHGLRDSTITRNVDCCRKALLFFWEKRRIRKISDITPGDIHNAFMASKDKSNLSTSLRSFFRYLYKAGVLGIYLSLSVPSVREPKVIPSIYTKEEMFRLLLSVDRSKAMGKRDYLIILLAQKLGMRSGDIANLKCGDIDFRAKKINFIQGKTLVPHQLELLPEIEEALLQYLKVRRSNCDIESIFLRVLPPFIRITRVAVGVVVRKAFKVSEICVVGKKHGPHSLRMTLASELVSEKVPYMVIGKILGHEDPNVANHYIKFDVEMLRTCALEVPKLSGFVAEKLNIFEGRQ
jgi:integrase